MRINKFIAQATGLSRRTADTAIDGGRVQVNSHPAEQGMTIEPTDTVTLDGKVITPVAKTTVMMLNKPAGYVTSRTGQGSQTIYDLLPADLHHLKPVGRLDKNSSGLILLTNDGELANQLTHPRYAKAKLYQVELDKPLADKDKLTIEQGVELEDGISKLALKQPSTINQKLVPDSYFLATMTEGRNRQIRRTFAALGYTVTALHRTRFGDYELGVLPSGQSKLVHDD